MELTSANAGMTLKQRMEAKIATCAPGFEQLPAAVIIHNIVDQTVVYMSQRGVDGLGITMQELLDMGPEYFPRFFDAEDAKDYVPKIFGLLHRNNNDEIVTFFQKVRTIHQSDWQVHLCSVTIFMRDDDGNPLLTLSVATAIDAQHNISPKVERLLDENDFLRQNKELFALMTRREREIMAQIAIGKNSAEMAEYFSCSEHTINTHRRNIKKKLNADTNYDIVRFVQAFDLM